MFQILTTSKGMVDLDQQERSNNGKIQRYSKLSVHSIRICRFPNCSIHHYLFYFLNKARL